MIYREVTLDTAAEEGSTLDYAGGYRDLLVAIIELAVKDWKGGNRGVRKFLGGAMCRHYCDLLGFDYTLIKDLLARGDRPHAHVGVRSVRQRHSR